MITSTAKILVQKNTRPGWWCLQVEQDISDYYNHLFRNGNVNGWRLPKNGPHITFIAGEKEARIVSQDDMKPYLDKQIPFCWNPVVMTDGRSFWLNCESSYLDSVRLWLGLEVPKKFGYHITLGNFK